MEEDQIKDLIEQAKETGLDEFLDGNPVDKGNDNGDGEGTEGNSGSRIGEVNSTSTFPRGKSKGKSVGKTTSKGKSAGKHMFQSSIDVENTEGNDVEANDVEANDEGTKETD